MAKPRIGEVTSLSPLTITLGGSTGVVSDVQKLSGVILRVGDAVFVLMYGNTLIVLGVVGGRHTVNGSIAADGSIVAGTGFSVVKTGTGLYTVTFTIAMPSRPSVVLTPQDTATSAASHASLANGAPPTTAGFNVVTANAAATTTINVPFDFIAMAT